MPPNPKAVALALKDDRLPIDASGYPVGETTAAVAKAVRRPMGVSYTEWVNAIDCAVEHFRMTAGLVEPKREFLQALSQMPNRIWIQIYHKDNIDLFHQALALKGIMKKGSGLTYDQRRLINVLSDMTMKGDINVRLKKAGISWEVFQNWQRDKAFKAQMDAMVKDITDDADNLIMMELVRGAVEGNLPKMQYYHQLTGRFDPNRDPGRVRDIRDFMGGLVEILTSELSGDRELLERIAGRLSELQERTIGK